MSAISYRITIDLKSIFDRLASDELRYRKTRDLSVDAASDETIVSSNGNIVLPKLAANDARSGSDGTGALVAGVEVDRTSDSVSKSDSSIEPNLLGSDVVFVGPPVAGKFGATITGTIGQDTLVGTAGDDVLHGLAGNDTLIGGAGADTLDGGDDVDLASYENATSADGVTGVTANLGASELNTGDAAGDTYIGIEGLTGSDFNDVLTGDSFGNILDGGNGADILDGGAGADDLLGGDGNDTYIVDFGNLDPFGNRTGGDVVIELANAGTDTVLVNTGRGYLLDDNVENARAIFGDGATIVGNSLDNIITGNLGDDTLDGGKGADVLIGGAGDDFYFVDDVGDAVIEQEGEGFDGIATTLNSYSLANVENVEELFFDFSHPAQSVTLSASAIDWTILSAAGMGTTGWTAVKDVTIF